LGIGQGFLGIAEHSLGTAALTEWQCVRLPFSLTFMGPRIVNVFLQVYQQDATLYNIFCCCQCSTCFRLFLRPSSGAQKLYTQHLVYVKLACCYR